MKWNKKGISFKILNMALFRLMFIVIILFVLFLFSTSLIRTNVDVSDIRDLVFFNRVFYSPSSISYTDDYIGRTYTGIVDINRFNDDTLTRAFNYTENKIAMRLELTNSENGEVKDAYLNKEWYERWEPLTSFEQYEKKIKWRYVMIKDGDSLYKGVVRIDMVIVNE